MLAPAYLDHNATTPLDTRVLEAMLPFLRERCGNASSRHDYGRMARKALDEARQQVAAAVGAHPTEVVFTSGGSEANNLLLKGAAASIGSAGAPLLAISAIEHPCVREPARELQRQGWRLHEIAVDETGRILPDDYAATLVEQPRIVSVMMANNETGVLFPVAEIAEIVKANSNALFHVDGVNAAGKVPIDLKNTEIDLFSISAHKFHGPKGIGALYIREGVDLPPLLIGGGQESGKRAGTEAVHQIVGLGEAAKFASDFSKMELVRRLRDKLEDGIISSIPHTSLNGTAEETRRLPNTSNLSFENTNGEMILYRLDEAGICVSTGSACNSGSHTASPVLQAMNIPYSKAMGSIRFSLGRFNDEAEIDVVLGKLPEMIESLRAMAA